MKFSGQAIALAAALVVMGSANAATSGLGEVVAIGGAGVALQSGSGSLAFSNGSDFDGVDPNTLGGLIGALNVGKVQVSGIGGALAFEDGLTIDGEYTRTSAGAAAQVVGLDVDTTTGQVLSVTSTGGALQTGTRISGTLTGGTASVTNLKFDLANRVVIADLAGTKAAVGTVAAVNFNLPGTTLWNIGAVTGPTALPVASLNSPTVVADMIAAGFTYTGLANGNHNFTASNIISGLTVTTAGFDFFKNSLGLLSTGQNALRAVNDDAQGWGTVTSELKISVSAVPEPSTYAMAALGLALVGMAARRRQSAK